MKGHIKMNENNLDTLWDTEYESMSKEFNTMKEQLLSSASQEIFDDVHLCPLITSNDTMCS